MAVAFKQGRQQVVGQTAEEMGQIQGQALLVQQIVEAVVVLETTQLVLEVTEEVVWLL